MTRHRSTAVSLTVAAALLGTLAGCGSAPKTPSGAGPGGRPGAAATPDDGAFTLVATGDILPHDSIIRQAKTDGKGSGYDFAPMLEGAKETATRADLAICHMETTYGRKEGPFSGYPAFVTPPDVAKAIRSTGYDSCSTASNHTLDDGAEGIARTLGALDEAGVKHVGSARDEAESTRPAVMKAGAATVAQLAYTYASNRPVPEDRPWAVTHIDEERILADARRARRDGADVVVVSMHWGDEWKEVPNEQQRTLADSLTRSETNGRRDIDLILGTHNHVPQPYEKVNGTWVVYGMGDQIAGEMTDPRGQLGTAARFTFAPPRGREAAWTVRKAEYIPFVMDNRPDHRLVNLGSTAGAQGGDHPTALRLIRDAVLSRGADKDGLVMGR